MSSSQSRPVALQLYKLLLREASKFPDLNFRSYSLRRIRDAFRDSRALSSQQQVWIQTSAWPAFLLEPELPYSIFLMSHRASVSSELEFVIRSFYQANFSIHYPEHLGLATYCVSVDVVHLSLLTGFYYLASRLLAFGLVRYGLGKI